MFFGYEGDVGESFVVGDSPRLQKLAQDCKEIHSLTANQWQNSQLTGRELYEFSEKLAQERGWQMKGRHMSGHRLSDFPHAAYYKGSFGEFSHAAVPYAWVLEIYLIDSTTGRGAFYEDLLY